MSISQGKKNQLCIFVMLALAIRKWDYYRNNLACNERPRGYIKMVVIEKAAIKVKAMNNWGVEDRRSAGEEDQYQATMPARASARLSLVPLLRAVVTSELSPRSAPADLCTIWSLMSMRIHLYSPRPCYFCTMITTAKNAWINGCSNIRYTRPASIWIRNLPTVPRRGEETRGAEERGGGGKRPNSFRGAALSNSLSSLLHNERE